MPSVFYNDENKICVIDLPRLMDKFFARNLTEEMSNKIAKELSILNMEERWKIEKIFAADEELRKIQTQKSL